MYMYDDVHAMMHELLSSVRGVTHTTPQSSGDSYMHVLLQYIT